MDGIIRLGEAARITKRPSIPQAPLPTPSAISLDIIPHLNRLFRLALSRRFCAGNAEDARDLVQDVCEIAIRRSSTYNADYPVWPWLKAIMISRHLRLLEMSHAKKRDAITLPLEEIRAAILPNQQEPLMIRDISRAFGRMPAKQRNAIIQELTIRDGPKSHAHRTHLSSAKAAIRKAIL